MSRLTERDNLGCVIHGDAVYSDWDVPEGFRGEAIEYLAALEDILYAPDGTERITLDRLRELIAAERDGRCVVLPCKLGATLHDAYEYFNGAEHPELYEIDASEITVKRFPSGKLMFEIDCNEYENDDFGKTVFLTRAEAEAALEGRG